jgi:DNA-binding MarR family transcriptional regulator
MEKSSDFLAIALFSELFMAEQLARNQLTRALPKGMELSQFSVLNHLAGVNDPRTPAQIAKTFNLTKGAITNTLRKLEWAGHININPDWNDARRKLVTISSSGKIARNSAFEKIAPIVESLITKVGPSKLREVIPVLRDLRFKLGESQ